MLIIIFISSCEEAHFSIENEDTEAKLQFRDIEVQLDVRRGTDLGLLLRVHVEDRGQQPLPFHVRFTGKGSDGAIMESNRYVATISDAAVLDSLGRETGTYEPAIIMVAAPLIRFDNAGESYPAIVECFLPYHWFTFTKGAQTFWLDMEAIAGEIQGDPTHDFGGVLAASMNQPSWGNMRIRLDFPMPKLYAAKVWVRKVTLDSSMFDPHQMDFSINKSNPEYGYPDLFWSLGLGYESVYASSYFQNSLSAAWQAASPVIYVRNRDEEISLCVMDWDNEHLFNNRHDLIACWEGRLIQISTDPKQPTILSFGRVSEMDVVMKWLEE
ncbi:MAG TPA: hypothetical protein ENJ82_01140 [Bacteroidetes bacterium]|nr:hypothetical protein [Bacteroidota bacterium]